jgi:hypothetical protein
MQVPVVNSKQVGALVGPTLVAMLVSEFPLVQPKIYDAQIPPVIYLSGEVFDMVIVSTDVTGPTAQVKVSELYAGLRYTGYLSLMMVDEDWKIVNKLYHSH